MSQEKRVKYTDPNFEETVPRWFEEVDSEDKENVSECEDNLEILSETGSIISLNEISGSDDENNLQATNIILVKNGFRWSMDEPPKTKTASRNIVVKAPGIKGNAKHIANVLQAWQTLFQTPMIDSIVIYTNLEISRQRDNYKDAKFVDPTDSVEILALIGLLYISGARKDAHLSICEMFSKQSSKIYYYYE
ncbi:unnamed protein product [Acanthoscelides obtectus]|uniref:Uncharacterized protein n=1 Tax=Acanthoscelides obtectus TaxID=200917 RepID=A0A9P0KE79_ACAOB|nr:unnamed protein product [Acanthoscelides obtectus]CAK1657534.1 hypothetical protein AOBTE_LOCUS20402 [Acanthoscelides obtectus]